MLDQPCAKGEARKDAPMLIFSTTKGNIEGCNMISKLSASSGLGVTLLCSHTGAPWNLKGFSKNGPSNPIRVKLERWRGGGGKTVPAQIKVCAKRPCLCALYKQLCFSERQCWISRAPRKRPESGCTHAHFQRQRNNEGCNMISN